MIREDNQRAGKSWTWTYDDAGNILSKKEYAYTTGTLGTVLSAQSYSYGNSNWGDLLTTYDGKTVSSDTIGNVLKDGTWTYAWEHGRELAAMSIGTDIAIKKQTVDFCGVSGDTGDGTGFDIPLCYSRL